MDVDVQNGSVFICPPDYLVVALDMDGRHLETFKLRPIWVAGDPAAIDLSDDFIMNCHVTLKCARAATEPCQLEKNRPQNSNFFLKPLPPSPHG